MSAFQLLSAGFPLSVFYFLLFPSCQSELIRTDPDLPEPFRTRSGARRSLGLLVFGLLVFWSFGLLVRGPWSVVSL